MASLYLVYDKTGKCPPLRGDGYVAVHFKDAPSKESIPEHVYQLALRHLDVLAGDD